MANVLPTTSIVAKEALRVLKNNLSFSRNVNRDYQDEFKNGDYSSGQTINIKRPPKYEYRAGRVAVPQDTVKTTIPLTLSQGGTDLQFTMLERTLSISRLGDVIQSAMSVVTNQIDLQGLQVARLSVGNTVGTVGTYPASQAAAIQLLTQAQQKLSENSAPYDGFRSAVLSPAMNAALVQGTAGLFNSNASIGKQNETGRFVRGFGLNLAEDQNIPVHVNGTAASFTVNGAGQTGNTLIVNAVSGTIRQGSVVTFTGVNAVNPVSRQDTRSLQQFVVTADVANGATSVPIYPPIQAAGPLQSVTASPANGATGTIFGGANATYETDFVYHRDAFTLAMVPMAEPEAGMGAKVSQESDDGFTVKVTKFYDGINDNGIWRLDVLFGWCATYPELAVKMVA